MILEVSDRAKIFLSYATRLSSAYPSAPPATGAASQLSAAGAAIAAIFGLVAAL